MASALTRRRAPARKGVAVSHAPRRRGETQQRVVAQLRRGLMIGAFVPGQVMSLRKLAQDLGTSPMPVREAINQLTAANVLEVLPNRSVRVPRMTRERFAELTKVRQALEGMAAEQACRGGNAALVRSLSRVNADLLEAIEARDILRCLAKNQEFHFTLYQASGSSVLTPLIEPLWLQAGPIMYFSLVSPDMAWDASAHRDVLAALRAGDAPGVRRAIERDIRNTAASLMKSSVFTSASGPLAELGGGEHAT
jgi:DNA-binding GntR family transcriptional regulator